MTSCGVPLSSRASGGISGRQIAKVLGIGETTVRVDLAGAPKSARPSRYNVKLRDVSHTLGAPRIGFEEIYPPLIALDTDFPSGCFH